MLFNDRFVDGILDIRSKDKLASELKRLEWRLCLALATYNECAPHRIKNDCLYNVGYILNRIVSKSGSTALDETLADFSFWWGDDVLSVFEKAIKIFNK